MMYHVQHDISCMFNTRNKSHCHKFKVTLHPHVSVVHVEFDENTGPSQDEDKGHKMKKGYKMKKGHKIKKKRMKSILLQTRSTSSNFTAI